MAEPPVAGVDVELLAGLRVLHDDRADIGQVGLPRVDEADRQDLVPSMEQVEGPFPTGCADEVGDDDDQRAPLDRVVGGFNERPQVGERSARQARLAEQILDEAEDLDPPPRAGIVRSTRLP